MVKQIFLHEAAEALRMIRRKPLVFVKIDGAHARKIQNTLLFPPDQLPIKGERGGAGCKAQYAVWLCLHDGLNDIRCRASRFFGSGYLYGFIMLHKPAFNNKSTM